MAQSNSHISGLLATLQNNLDTLVKARDAQTVHVAYELQQAIDNIRAEMGYPIGVQLGNRDVPGDTERPVAMRVAAVRSLQRA